MSKRFQKTRIVDKWGGIYDSKTDRILDVNDVGHKLNEQQATINKLKSDIEETEISIKLFEDDVNRLSEENEQLKGDNNRLKYIIQQLRERYEYE